MVYFVSSRGYKLVVFTKRKKCQLLGKKAVSMLTDKLSSGHGGYIILTVYK